MLAPLVPLYAAAVRAKNLAYERGWARPKRLRWPVVSIGNLSMGGSGKTPLTIRLAQLLRERGFAVDVLSRGYGRQSKVVERVTTGGSAEEFGDEPLLIAEAAGVPVFVGANRYRAGMLAEASAAGPVLHLLDDGFQHRRTGSRRRYCRPAWQRLHGAAASRGTAARGIFVTVTGTHSCDAAGRSDPGSRVATTRPNPADVVDGAAAGDPRDQAGHRLLCDCPGGGIFLRIAIARSRRHGNPRMA